MDLWALALTLKPFLERVCGAAEIIITANEVRRLLQRLLQGEAGRKLLVAVWRAQCNATLEVCALAYKELNSTHWRGHSAYIYIHSLKLQQLDTLTTYLEDQARRPRPPKTGASPDPVAMAQAVNHLRLSPDDWAKLAGSLGEAYLDMLASVGQTVPQGVSERIMAAPGTEPDLPGGWAASFARWMERELKDAGLARQVADAVDLALSALLPIGHDSAVRDVAASLQTEPATQSPSPWRTVEEVLGRHFGADPAINLRLRSWLPFLLHVPQDELENQIHLLRTQLEEELAYESIAAKYGMEEVTQRIREALNKSPDAGAFVGRGADLKSLHRFLDGPGGRLVITAPAGTGKSALLAVWIRELSSFSDCFVAHHFFLQAYPVTQPVVNAYRNILRQLLVYYNQRPEALGHDPTELRGMIMGLLAQERHLPKKLIIILDGLDEASEAFDSPFPADLPDDVYIVVSARAKAGDEPNYLRGWGGFRRFALDALSVPAVRDWLVRVDGGSLCPFLRDEFVVEVQMKTEGLPLMIGLVVADLVEEVATNNHPGSRLAATPRGLAAYVNEERRLLSLRLNDPTYERQLNLLYLLTVAHGALSALDVYRLTKLTTDHIATMAPRIRRWILVTRYDGEQYYTFCHRAIGEVLSDEIGFQAAEARLQLLAYCREYRMKPTQYIRRFYAGHLAQAIIADPDEGSQLRRELFELALDEHFLHKQRGDHELPGLPLRTLQTAMSALSLDDAGRVAELLLARFRRLMEVARESPLEVLADRSLTPDQQMLRALGIVELLGSREAALWLMLMAWALREADRPADMQRVLGQLRLLELPPLQGAFGWMAAVLLSQLADMDESLSAWIMPSLNKPHQDLLKDLLASQGAGMTGAAEGSAPRATELAAALARGEMTIADVRRMSGPDGLVGVITALAEAGHVRLATEVAVSPWDPTQHISLLTHCGQILMQVGLTDAAADAFSRALRAAERIGTTTTGVWRAQARVGAFSRPDQLPEPLRQDAETLAAFGVGRALAGQISLAEVVLAHALSLAGTPAAAEAVVRAQIESGLLDQAAQTIPLMAGSGRRAALWMELARATSRNDPHLAEVHYRRAVAEGTPMDAVIVRAANAGMTRVALSLAAGLEDGGARDEAFRQAVQAYIRFQSGSTMPHGPGRPAGDSALVRAELAQRLSQLNEGARASDDWRTASLVELHLGAGEFESALSAARDLREGRLRYELVRHVLDQWEQNPGGVTIAGLSPLLSEVAVRSGVRDGRLAQRLLDLALDEGEVSAALRVIPMMETLKAQALAAGRVASAIFRSDGQLRGALYLELIQSVLRSQRPTGKKAETQKNPSMDPKNERRIALLLRCALMEIQRRGDPEEGTIFVLLIAEISARLAARLLPLTLVALIKIGRMDHAVEHLCAVLDTPVHHRAGAGSDGVQILDVRSGYQVFQDAWIDLLEVPGGRRPRTERPWMKWGAGELRWHARDWLGELVDLADRSQFTPQGTAVTGVEARPVREDELDEELTLTPSGEIHPAPAGSRGMGFVLSQYPQAPDKQFEQLLSPRSGRLTAPELSDMFGALDRLRYNRDLHLCAVAQTLAAAREVAPLKELLVRYLFYTEEAVLFICKLLCDLRPAAYDEVLKAVAAHLTAT